MNLTGTGAIRSAAAALAVALTLGAAAADSAAPRALPKSILASDDVHAVQVHVGRSVIVRTSWPVKRVSITQADIADVEVMTPTQVLVMGKMVGSTDLILWSESEDTWSARVDTSIDVTALGAELGQLFPGASLQVTQSRDVVVVSGTLRSAEQTMQLKKLLDSYDVKYLDMTSLAGVQQVMLHVRVAEVSRQAIRLLGINALYGGKEFFGGQVVGPASGGPLNPISIGAAAGSVATGNIPFTFLSDAAVASGITLFGGFPGSDLEIFIQALKENQYVRLLAEPTLVAMSGEEGSFLAGGEFPVPIVQGGDSAGTSITVEYKEFGVRLAFKPIVLGDNSIRLHLAPEVSDLSDFGAVEIEGFRIPSVLTRRAETTLELHSGQSFAIAGLLKHDTVARKSAVPLLGDLPIIGPLFRSTRYQTGETELVVLVTASLVEPMSSATSPMLPGDAHVNPNDWEFYVEGRLEGKSPAKLSPSDAQWLRELGLDELSGPGAWANYDNPVAQSQADRHSTSAAGEPGEPGEPGAPGAPSAAMEPNSKP